MTTRATLVRRAFILLLALTPFLPMAARADDPVRGRDLATRWCTACHVVADDIAGGTIGPAFAAITTLHGRTREQVVGWLAAPHQPMPDFGLSAREINDLSAYINSIKMDRKSVPVTR
jgi:mono/diheme cytochrome c family protein